MAKPRNQKNSNQLSGELVRVSVLGCMTETIGGTIVTKAGMQTLVGHVVGVGDRQQDGAVSSYSAEGWPYAKGPKIPLHAPFTEVDTAIHRVQRHAKAAKEARVRNIAKSSGRPRKS